MQEQINLSISASSTGTARYWSFSFAEFGGWAVFTINEDTKEFSIQSDWGDWCHRWPAAGVPGNLLEFLSECDAEYIVRKFRLGQKDEFRQLDMDATLGEMHREVLRQRREEQITKDDAREVWEDLQEWRQEYWEEFGGYSDEAVITISQMNAPGSVERMDLLQDEWVCYKPTNVALFLKNELLPFFFKHVKEEGL